jgi:ABC-type lipoprotein export system ATPase subunit
MGRFERSDIRMRTDPLGSIWRKWDLHFHTPASFDYENKSLTASNIAKKLIEAGLEVVAVTDHHRMDAKFIRELQASAPDKLTILPGIELRSELGGSESVHFIGIFSEDCNIEDVWTKLQGRLSISDADVKKKGDDKVWVSFEKGCQAIRDLGGVVTVHAGRKTNSIEKLSNADLVKRAIKADLAHQHIDCLEVGAVEDCKSYTEIVFPAIGTKRPLLLCSDNHNAEKYSTKCPMWVKGDPGFNGLLELINEPESRVFLGDEPPSMTRVALDSTKYMESLTFHRTDDAKATEMWFGGNLQLNPGLVAVIGDKGSGKSAVADILALTGNTYAGVNFSFLKKDRFLTPKTRLGSMFEGEVTWRSGQSLRRRLDASCDRSSPELVKYIPQNYLETICTELKESSETEFDRELMDVIYSHVSEADRLGRDTLTDLISYLTNETEERIQSIESELSSLNLLIADLEDQATPEFKKALNAQLNLRQLELKAHDQARPPEVKEPQTDPEAQAAITDITLKLSSLDQQIGKLTEQIKEAEVIDKACSAKIAAAEKLLNRILNLDRQIELFFAESMDDANLLEVDLKQLVELRKNLKPVQDIKQVTEETRRQVRDRLSRETPESLSNQLIQAERAGKEYRDGLDQPNRLYQTYLHALKSWQKKRDEILGEAATQGSLRGLEARIAALAELPGKIRSYELKRLDLVGSIFSAKGQLLHKYCELYAPVQEFIDAHPISKEQGALQFRATIAPEGIADELLSMIHLGRRGSFQGEQEGREKLQEFVVAADFSTLDGVNAFLSRVVDSLKHDRREPTAPDVRLNDQLRQDSTVSGVYDFVFGLSYLKPRFELRWQDKPLDQLSPGERGNLLLIFYLLIDKRTVPLIIDQPEENLDNRTIAKMLVPAIKDAKERRQIVMVTHNPNLAVVCDADQVVHAKFDKAAGNRITYTSGSLENAEITQLIVDVLEGTKPAFDLRDAKYRIMQAIQF